MHGAESEERDGHDQHTDYERADLTIAPYHDEDRCLPCEPPK